MNLSTSYLGMRLSSPLIVGSSPLNVDGDLVHQYEEAGAGAIVLPSILQEQLVYRSLELTDPLSANELSGHVPQQDHYNGGVRNYLKSIQWMKRHCRVPIIASLHGASTGPWLDYVREIQACGADALELNWQVGRCNPDETGEEVESRMLAWVSEIRAKVKIPISIKMSNRFINPATVALRLQDAGVNGIVLFAHRPHWDVDIYRLHWTIGWELSPHGTLGRTLEGIVETRTDALQISVAASGGVRTGDDALKTIIAGADAVMVVSEIYRQGTDAIAKILLGIRKYLDSRDLTELDSFKAQRQGDRPTTDVQMRAEIVDPLTGSLAYHDPLSVAAS